MRKAKVFFRIREIRNIRKADEWKNIEKEAKADIINLSDTKEVADVHIVGKIDREIYKFISILQDPDFIFQDKKNTALVCKEFTVDDKYINIVLRLVVSTDNPEYKNSII